MEKNQRRIELLGSACSQPSMYVSSSQRDLELNLPDGTVFASSGVEARYVASVSETAASLAADAVRRAISSSQIHENDIDCLIAASASMDQALPYNAAMVHRELGWRSGERMTFDVNASCMSFLVALDQVSCALQFGRFRNVVIVSSDISSCALNWKVLESSAIFGDGAAAFVVSRARPGSNAEILASNFLTISEGAEFCEVRGSGSRYHPTRTSEDLSSLCQFRMNGRAIFKLVAKYLPHFIDDLCRQAQIRVDDLAWIVPHQASRLAMQHLTERLGFRPERVVDIFSTRGNQVAASLPTAMHVAMHDGRIAVGDVALLIGTGAGLSIGGMILKV